MKKTSIMNAVKHINFLLDKSPQFKDRYEKFFAIFDERHNPYLVTFGLATNSSHTYKLTVYKANKKVKSLNSEESIGLLKFVARKGTDSIYLELINVIKKKNSNKGIGTEMLTVMQMIGHNMGVKIYNGAFGNFDYLNKKPESLENFYTKNNFIFPEEYSGSSFEKIVTEKELDIFKRKTMSYPVGKKDIIVLIPENKLEASSYLDELEN